MGDIGPKAFYGFISEKKIIAKTVILVMGSLISSFVRKIIKDFVYPLAKGNLKRVKKNLLIAKNAYPIMVINIIVTTYFLFVISTFF
jgi:hypothetical protein